ncbi:uncharacterized protein J4E92_002879 [Alternaria infectoria]|uniref:uncharacterized protein n=1 Tax=Alternaria infectoria TaxID=45303 RepID=UPI0022207431|nr:uncharacterized protein J4E92_002879 [Alternaria infectoria]KAI4935588.1 hypothetical protein J4E92_002879 [Alternaria infectoria]
MKQRITYVVTNPEEFTPDQLDVGEDNSGPYFALDNVYAAKEHRITLGLNELPEECSSTSSSSTKVPVLSERFSMSATSQYYSYLDDIDQVRSFFQQKFCKKYGKSHCLDAIDGFAQSDYIDVDYDTISRSVVLTAESSNAGSTNEGRTETIRLPSKEATVEIGVLSLEGNADPEDVQFGGFLTVLGQDDKPNRSCKLHTHLTLPSYLFIDKYQFSDTLFLADKNLKRLRSLAGATDLEAPDWVVPAWGSAALFELATPKPEKIEYPKGDVEDEKKKQ